MVKEGCKETVRRMQKGRFSSMAKMTYPNALLTMKKRLTIQLKENSAGAVVWRDTLSGPPSAKEDRPRAIRGWSRCTNPPRRRWRRLTMCQMMR